MIIKEINILTALSKSRLPDCDYVINPYVGCTHRCAYCYARYMRYYTGHREDWGEFVDVKSNIGWALEKQLKSAGRSSIIKKGLVFMSSVTDPYQPIERKYELTKRCLELLLRYDWPVSILTKSDLVLRDIDILKKFNEIEVGFSISSLDDEKVRLFESGSGRVEDRINAIEELNKNNIKTYVFLAPVFPYITDLEKLFKYFSGKVQKIYVETLNTQTVNWTGVKEVLIKSSPSLLPRYEEIFFGSEKHKYLAELGKTVTDLSKYYNIEAKLYTHE